MSGAMMETEEGEDSQFFCWSPLWPDGFVEEWNQTEVDRLAALGCNCSLIFQPNISNVHCQPYPFQHEWWVPPLYICAFSLIILLSVCGNGVVIWLVLGHRRMRTVTNYFLVNLALADTSISVLNVCFTFTFNLYYDWYFGRTYCYFNNFMGVTPTLASVFTMVAMSLDRYMALVHPLSYRLSRKSAVLSISAIWLLAIVCGLPMLFVSRLNLYYFYDEEKQASFRAKACLADNFPDGYADSSLFKTYQWFNLIIGYVLPLLIVAVTYSLVAKALWGGRSIGDSHSTENVTAKRKVIKMLGCVVAIFMVCWLPYQLYFSVFIWAFKTDPLTMLYIFINFYWLAMSSTTVNPIIYCWMNSRFRIGFKYVFRWLPCVKVTRLEYRQSGLFDVDRRVGRTTTDAPLVANGGRRKTTGGSGRHPSFNYSCVSGGAVAEKNDSKLSLAPPTRCRSVNEARRFQDSDDGAEHASSSSTGGNEHNQLIAMRDF